MSVKTIVFEDLEVDVTEGVYEPAEDTFLLCQHLNITQGDRLLEIGTGCGLVAIVAAKKGAHVVATDQSPLAVKNARKNVAHNNFRDRIEVRLGWLFEPIHQDERFTVIAFNPPYLPGTQKDPAFDSAWSGGKDGREITEAFLLQCTKFLDAEGRLLLVQSSLSNPDKTGQMLKTLFHESSIKCEEKFFFEHIILFEAKRPRQKYSD
ncbi:MAG: HemK2/MTQ2 family protein methyltransferase [Promethearchaeota archaeon]